MICIRAEMICIRAEMICVTAKMTFLPNRLAWRAVDRGLVEPWDRRDVGSGVTGLHPLRHVHLSLELPRPPLVYRRGSGLFGGWGRETSAFQPRHRDAFHEVPLGGEEQDHAREHADDAGGHEQVDVAHAVLAAEGVQGER